MGPGHLLEKWQMTETRKMRWGRLVEESYSVQFDGGQKFSLEALEYLWDINKDINKLYKAKNYSKTFGNVCIYIYIYIYVCVCECVCVCVCVYIYISPYKP